MRKLPALLLFLCVISLSAARSQVNDDSTRTLKLMEQARNILSTRPDSARLIIDSAISLAAKSDLQRLWMRAVNLKGSWFWRQGMLDSAGIQYMKVKNKSKKLQDTTLLITANNNLGLVYHKIASSDSAEYFFKEAIRLAEQAGLENDKAISQNELAVVFMTQNRNLEAIDLLKQSAKVLSKTGDSFRLTQQYASLGWMYQSTGEFEKSINHYRKALLANKNNKTVDFAPVIYNNMGMTFQNLSSHKDSAKYYYLKALNLAMENPSSSVTSPTINLGNIFYDENEYTEALRYYKIALSSEGIERQFRPYAAILINMGLANSGLNNFDTAQYYLKKGLYIAEKNNLLEFQQNAYYGLFQLDSARNRMSSALNYYIKAEDIEDSLKQEKLGEKIKQLEYEQDILEREQDNAKLTARNQLQSQTIRNQWVILISAVLFLVLAVLAIILLSRSRKKQKELNLLLEERNREIERKKQELERTNKTKDKLFTIIAHDLRNPFDALLGLLKELDENYDDYDEEFRKEIISSLLESSNNAYKMLLDLLEWSRAQRGNINYTPFSFNVREVLDEVYTNYIPAAKAKSIKLEVQAENGSHVRTDPQFVRSILSNLLNNAIKFTPEGGQIVVKTEVEKEKLKIKVEDSGIGIPKEKINKLFETGSDFQRYGTAEEAGTGLGLVMCREYVRMMDENIWVHSEEGKGSVFGFTVPLS